MKDEFKLIITIKKMNIEIIDITKLFPNREKVLRDNIIDESFNLLKNSYKANIIDISDKRRLDIQDELLTSVDMLDYYLELAYHYKYIGDSKVKSIGRKLSEISKMVKSWRRYTLSMKGAKNEKNDN